MNVSDVGGQLAQASFIVTCVGAGLALIVMAMDRHGPPVRRLLEFVIVACGVLAAQLLLRESHENQQKIAALQIKVGQGDSIIKSDRSEINMLNHKISLQQATLKRHQIKLEDHDHQIKYITNQIDLANLKRRILPPAVTALIQASTDHDKTIYEYLRETSALSLNDNPECRAQGVTSIKFLFLNPGEIDLPKCVRPMGGRELVDADNVHWLIVPFAEGDEAIKTLRTNNLLAYVFTDGKYKFLGTLPVVTRRIMGAGFDLFEGKLRVWNASAISKAAPSLPSRYLVQLWRYNKQSRVEETGEYCSLDETTSIGYILASLFGGHPSPIDPPFNADLRTPKSCLE